MNKEKLAKDIEELKSKLAEMEAELEKPEKFEWKYKKDETYLLGTNSRFTGYNGDSEKNINHGRYRLSKQCAEYSLERNRVANRLEALVEQIEPDYVVPKVGYNTWFIYFTRQGKYMSTSICTIRTIGVIYMSKETANKICELLNSGEVVL